MTYHVSGLAGRPLDLSYLLLQPDICFVQVQLVLDRLIVVLGYFLLVSLNDTVLTLEGGDVWLVVFVLLLHEILALVTTHFCQKLDLLLKVLDKHLLLGIGLLESVQFYPKLVLIVTVLAAVIYLRDL